MVAAFPGAKPQNAPDTQAPTVALEALTKNPEGAATVTFTAVYVPAVTDWFATIRFVSDWSRVNSKFVEGFDENTDTVLPLDGVNVIPIIGNVKLTTVVFAGGLSEIVILRLALPPPLQFVHGVFSPLHELKAKIVTSAIKTSVFFEFIHIPHARIWQTAPVETVGWESPVTL
jgi:hypothetical protein